MKGLEAITNLIPRFYDDLPNVSPKEYVRLEKVRGELLGIVEKELKAINVIKSKDFIDLKLLKRCKTHWDYNRQVAIRYDSRGMDIALLTEEEYDLLKEVLL